MKNLIISGILGAALPFCSAPISAAPNVQKATLKWPMFRQTASKKSVPEVAAIQYLLRSRGFYNRQSDGIFGALTAASVRAFQVRRGLKADGIVGSQTFAKLNSTLQRGDKGDAVRALQIVLNDILRQSEVHGISPVKVDGVFGSQTDEAIRVHQRVLEIKSNGIVSAPVWCSLFGGEIG